jgi:pimeloyl-ACP methyl ester carboxylesterase
MPSTTATAPHTRHDVVQTGVRRAGPIAAWTVAALSGAAAAAWIPRGPATRAEVAVLLAGAALVGLLAGTRIRSRWALLGVPLAHLLVYEVLRATVFRLDGATFARPRFDVSLGVLVFLAVHVMYAVVAIVPMIGGLLAGRAWQRARTPGLPYRAGLAAALVVALAAAGIGVLLLRPGGVAPVAGGVAEMARVRLGGTDQWVSLRGRDAGNPVLLHLSGGPGSSDVGWVRTFNAPLEEHFTVAVWEQRGVGKSYPAVDPAADLTLDRMVADGIELSAWLARRFGQEKIYLTGNSWGSTLGVLMAQRRPELFRAYAGTGQMVSQRETDRILYRQLLAHADRIGDRALHARLTALGPPPYRDVLGYALVMEYYDALEPYEHVPAYDRVRGLTGFFPGEYSLLHTWNELRGFADMGGLLYPRLQHVDLRADVPRLEVPVYFMQGRHELTARSALADEWIAGLSAPVKRVYLFERSGHNPDAEEPARFNELMVRTVLAETGGR